MSLKSNVAIGEFSQVRSRGWCLGETPDRGCAAAGPDSPHGEREITGSQYGLWTRRDAIYASRQALSRQ